MSGRNLLLVALSGLLLFVGTSQAQPKKSDSEVKITATADKPDADGKQLVTVTLVVNKGWHAYANPVGNKDLEENQTTVTIAAGGKKLDATLDFPQGKLVTDALLGNYRVYEDKVTIKAKIQRGKETGPLEVSVKVQVCSDKTCLLPATVKVTVP